MPALIANPQPERSRNTESVTCRHCSGTLSSGGWYGVHRAFHERVCEGASDTDRAYWKKHRRWPWNGRAGIRALSERMQRWLSEGRCRSCGTECDENPRTGELFRYCYDHRRYHRELIRAKRAAIRSARGLPPPRKRMRTQGERMARKAELGRIKRAAALLSGNCTHCFHRKATGGTRKCDGCRATAKRNGMALYRRRKAAGLCPYCGDPAMRKRIHCKGCLRDRATQAKEVRTA